MDVKGVIHHGRVGDSPLFNVAHSEVLVNSLMVKSFAVIVDATIVRMVLVPSTMALMGIPIGGFLNGLTVCSPTSI